MTARRLSVLAGLITVLTIVPGAARSDDATSEDVGRLAAAAREDPSALERIRAVTSIDGHPVDMGSVLATEGAELTDRLTTLADLAPAADPIDADEAARNAASILASREFQRGGSPTSPGWLQRLGDWLSNLIPDSVAGALGSRVVWVILLIAVAVTAVVLLVRARRRRSGPDDTGASPSARRRPSDLEEAARRAAAGGDYSTAVRLWFEAGAIRLADQGIVPYEATATSGAIRRAVPTDTVAGLAATFDRIAYGRRVADRDDAVAAERGWAEVAAHTGSARG